ncbi:MAG: DUF5685 family protein [Oscillospiraceae bacterium]|nr:DUF5685 family protein [Oscillospiraceae bacterium]
MFGYIRPFKPDLRIREFETWKAVYCGLCGQLGRSFGPAARLTLSYDFAFLAMLRYSVAESDPVFGPGRCFVNPLRRLPLCRGDQILEFGADMASIMLYYKVLDNMLDGGPLSRAGWGTLKPLAAGARKKAAAREPYCDLAVGEAMAGQASLEESGCKSVDQAAEPTAKAMEAIFGELSRDENKRRVLKRTGYLLGRYVYLCDALDDLQSDLKKGSYNPFAQEAGLTRDSGGGELEAVYERGRDAIYLTAGEAGRAWALLEPARFGSILDNVFYSGLRFGADEIYLRRAKKTGGDRRIPGCCAGCRHSSEATSSKEKPL